MHNVTDLHGVHEPLHDFLYHMSSFLEWQVCIPPQAASGWAFFMNVHRLFCLHGLVSLGSIGRCSHGEKCLFFCLLYMCIMGVRQRYFMIAPDTLMQRDTGNRDF